MIAILPAASAAPEAASKIAAAVAIFAIAFKAIVRSPKLAT